MNTDVNHNGKETTKENDAFILNKQLISRFIYSALAGSTPRLSNSRIETDGGKILF